MHDRHTASSEVSTLAWITDADHLRSALAQYHLPDRSAIEQRCAAVAIIIAGAPKAPSICFIQRVQRENDHWSGDIAFPGGWEEDVDADLVATAVRETQEEIGLILQRWQYCGILPALPITLAALKNRDLARAIPLIVASVHWGGATLPALQPNGAELSDAFWVTLADILDPTHQTQYRTAHGSSPGIHCQRGIIWGLTYRLLQRFMRVAVPAGNA